MKSAFALVLTSFVAFVAALPADKVNPAAKALAEAGGFPDLKSDATAAGVIENELSGPCKPVTVIFARGTTEAGNVGLLAGPPAFTLLRASLGTAGVAVQGVDYPAVVAGYLAGGDPAGSTTMFNLINQAATKCPETKIVIGGYSQGAQLTHNAAARLSSSVTSRIAAAFVFGDPFRGRAVGSIPSSKVLSICHPLDIICNGYGTMDTHLTYSIDAATVAAFIASRV
jgi:cutinase